MSAFRRLMAKGDADHTKLSHVEFVLYVSGKNTKGSGVDSDACNEYEALQSELSRLRAVAEAAKRLVDECGWLLPGLIANNDYEIRGHLLDGLAIAEAALERAE